MATAETFSHISSLLLKFRIKKSGHMNTGRECTTRWTWNLKTASNDQDRNRFGRPVWISLFLDENDVAVVPMVAGSARWCVFGDEPVDEVFYGRRGAEVNAEVFRCFEHDHMRVPP
jgi:hypothetical protein